MTTQPDGAEALTERIAGALRARMPAGDHGDYCRTLAAAVLAVAQQDRAELASLAINAANALRDEKRHYEIACQEIARLNDLVDRLGQTNRQQLDTLARVRAYIASQTAAMPDDYPVAVPAADVLFALNAPLRG